MCEANFTTAPPTNKQEAQIPIPHMMEGLNLNHTNNDAFVH